MPTWLNPAGFNEKEPEAPGSPAIPVMLFSLLGGALVYGNGALAKERAAYAAETLRLRKEAEAAYEKRMAERPPARFRDFSREAYRAAKRQNLARGEAQQARLDAWLDDRDLSDLGGRS